MQPVPPKNDPAPPAFPSPKNLRLAQLGAREYNEDNSAPRPHRGGAPRAPNGKERQEMWNNCKKAVTFSYDDGVESDRRLLEIFNRYGMKATFNLNSGLLGLPDAWEYKGFAVRRLPLEGLPELYRGHEIAVHGQKHLHPAALGAQELSREMEEDKRRLEELFGTPMRGMAYAFGEYNAQVIETLRRCGLRYARTVKSTHSFAPQNNLLEFHPTCHHSDPELFALIDRFLAAETDEPQLLYIWGHAYELDGGHDWDRMERICEKLAGKSGVFYGTNSEVLLGE